MLDNKSDVALRLSEEKGAIRSFSETDKRKLSEISFKQSDSSSAHELLMKALSWLVSEIEEYLMCFFIDGIVRILLWLYCVQWMHLERVRGKMYSLVRDEHGDILERSWKDHDGQVEEFTPAMWVELKIIEIYKKVNMKLGMNAKDSSILLPTDSEEEE